MAEVNKNQLVCLISFSGMDGSGKSTQIGALLARLEALGLRVRLVTFWEDVAKLKAIRESAGHAVFHGDKGVGSPSNPIERRDKNVRSPFMTCVRLCLYVLDAISLQQVTRIVCRSNVDVILFDRYIYDELVNLPLRNPIVRIYARLLLWLVPRPHVSFLLDADPVEARARKPEYPLDFLHQLRKSYLELNDLSSVMTVIAPSNVREVERTILQTTFASLSIPQKRTVEDFANSSFAHRGQ